MVKECSKCRAVLPFDAFSPNKFGLGGRVPACRMCRSKHGKAVQKPGFCDINNKVKECNVCKSILPFDEFYHQDSSRGGVIGTCKKCSRAKSRDRYSVESQKKQRLFCDVDNKIKTCTTCLKVLPFEQFSRAIRGAGGRRAKCKQCHKDYGIRFGLLDPRSKHRKKIKYLYGLTLEQYDAMLVAQNGQCAICSKHMDKPHVDHCHATGDVRELLCRNCNHGIGNFKDNTEHLSRAIEYLARHKGKNNA